jgi:hypothetical protein
VLGGFLCAAAILSTYYFARRALVSGLITILIWGYAYGIMRANLASIGSYFIFDCALAGLYLGRFETFISTAERQFTNLRCWVVALIAWPTLILLLPFQPIEISLVGLRGNVAFIPAILLGARLRDQDLSKLSLSVAFLNIASLSMAVAEYFSGIERFYPQNSVTELVYNMHDVAEHTYYRIPGTFVNQAAYAHTMIMTLPLLYGAVAITFRNRYRRTVLILGVLAALFGILLGASRSAFVLATLATTFALTSSTTTRRVRVSWCVVLVCVAAVAATNGRMQRFTTLQDTDAVETRLAGSINSTFWEILVDNPMGNGLGGGGTSIPYFWESHVRRVVGLESEYSRILIEQTLFGLLLWLCFLAWVFLRRVAFVTTVWREGRRLAWFVCLATFCQGMIGVGMFSSVPQTLLMFLWIGWFLIEPRPPHQRVPVLTTRLGKTVIYNNTVVR